MYLDHFTSTVEDLHTEYLFPQECGRRLDPRWLTFRDASGVGFEVVPDRCLPAVAVDDSRFDASEEGVFKCSGQLPVGGEGTDRRQVWGWSASRYSMEKLTSCAHNHELHPDSDGAVHIHLDRAMMGLGGYDSWSPNVAPECVTPVGVRVEGRMVWKPVFPAV